MTAIYLESSAVLAWLFGEPNASQVQSAVDSADAVVTSVLTEIETLRSINRAVASLSITAANAQHLVGLFANAKLSWVLLEITPQVRARAGNPFPSEPIRSLDAIHLASALIALEAFPDLKIMTCDKRISENAKGLGLDVY